MEVVIMLINVITFIDVMALLLFLGASVYVSFFHQRNESQPIYNRKRKLSFNQYGKKTNKRRKIKVNAPEIGEKELV